MPENKKDDKETLSMQQKRLQRFYYDMRDVEEIFNVEIKESVEKKEKKVNEEVMPVYDIEAKAWKSFRWDSIKQVRFEL